MKLELLKVLEEEGPLGAWDLAERAGMGLEEVLGQLQEGREAGLADRDAFGRWKATEWGWFWELWNSPEEEGQ